MYLICNTHFPVQARVYTSFLMYWGRIILYLQLRKQHICVYQTKSICRENTVLKFLGLVSHSQGYGNASDCSTVTPLSASNSTKEIQRNLHVHNTYQLCVLHPLDSLALAWQSSYSWNHDASIQSKSGPNVWIYASLFPPELEPLEISGLRGPISKVAAAKPLHRSVMIGGAQGVLRVPRPLLDSAKRSQQKSWERKNCLKIKTTNPVMTSGSGQPLASTLNGGFQTPLALRTSAVSCLRPIFSPSCDATSVIWLP